MTAIPASDIEIAFIEEGKQDRFETVKQGIPIEGELKENFFYFKLGGVECRLPAKLFESIK